MRDRVVLAADIGTTGVKTLAVDPEGNILFAHAIEYPLYIPGPGLAEQDPEEILSAVGRCVRTVIDGAGIRQDQVVCLSFSSAMHSLIGMDESGTALTRSLTWADGRSAEQAARLDLEGSGLPVYLRTGTPIHPMSPLVKLIWMREKSPEVFNRARCWIGIKEYILFRLFGRYVTDYSLASATGLFNLSKLRWDEGALELAGIREEQLPEAIPTTGRLTGMHAGLASEWGLRQDTPVVIGASDGVLANLGIGAMEQGRYAVTIGTSSALRAASPWPVTDPHGRLFCYALTEDQWVVGGASNNGGIVTQWAGERWFPGRPLHEVLPLAGSVPPGAEGLLFLPLLTGERAPFRNASAKGVMIGLTLKHTERHMLRAAMEGVLFQIRGIAGLVSELAGPPGEIRASGGFARSPLWCGMMADMLGVSIRVPNAVESSALGAAALGYYAMSDGRGQVSGWPDGEAVTYEPDDKNHQIYNELLPVYLGVYDRLAESMKELNGFMERKRH